MHLLYYSYAFNGLWRWWSSAVIGREAGYNLDRSAVHHRLHVLYW